MGIEKFFSTLSQIPSLWLKIEYPYIKKLSPKILLIDFNSIVHVTSSRVLFNYKENIETNILNNIETFINHLLNDVINSNKLEIIYFAVDGVPSFGKMKEQIKRRYMGEILKRELNYDSIWSKNNITPGTKFMTNLNLYL